MTIRRKLAVALALPLVALIVLTATEIARAAAAVDDVTEQTELAEAVIGPAGIVTALQNERTWLAVELIGQAGSVTVPVEGTEETRAQTDAAIAAFQEDLSSGNDLVAAAFSEPVGRLAELDEVRAQVDASTAPHDISNLEFSDGIFARYSALIAPLFDATTRVALAVDDPDLRQGAMLADTLARQIEALSLLLNSTISYATLSDGGIDTPEEIALIAGYVSDFREYSNTLREPSGSYAELAAEWFPTALTDRIDAQVDAALLSGAVDLPTLLAAVDVPENESFIGYQRAVHGAVTDRANDLRSSAEARQLWFGGLATLALVAAVTLTILVSRSITHPLRTLTGQAKLMAERRLPDAVLDILETPLGDDVKVPSIEPVAVRTRDEVADVAVALNTVQDSALDLAVEQAVLRRNIADSFVNLGRRNQSLLGRQLDFVTELESNETDPDTLASLFRLDHLATRMRRNAESLLVLAGIEPPRKWAAPVRVTDVIRAALGEVEDYQRVAIRSVEPATVLGSAAADLAHLIAELLENALTFSPPDQSVEVRGHHRADGEYALAVIDAGFGMSAADIEQANRRLSGVESFTIAPSKYLGHYVAGNLAARHGIRIELSSTPGRGVTAQIELPATLLTTDAPAGDPITDPHGNRVLALAPSPAGPGAGSPSPGGSPAPLPAAPSPAGPANPAPLPAAPSPAARLTPWAPAAPPADAAPAARDAPAAWDAGGSEPTPARPPGTGDVPAPAAPGPERAPGEDGTERTPSGLVKRSALGSDAGDRPISNVPSGELLAALSDHADRLKGQAGAPGRLPGPGPSGASAAEPWAPPGGSPFGAGPPGPADQTGRRDPVGGPVPPPSGPTPAPGPRPSLPSRPGAGGPGGDSATRPPLPGGPGGGRGGGRPLEPDAPGARGVPGTPGSSGQPVPPATPGIPGTPGTPSPLGRDPVRAFLESGAASPDAAFPGRRTPSHEGAPSETTSSGLARRVRGAQLPTAQPPPSLRRSTAEQPPQATQARQRRQDPPPRSGKAAAEDVYGFLSSFNQGVQRGLDESRRSERD